MAILLFAACNTGAQTDTVTLTLASTSSPLGLGQNLFEVTVTDRQGQPVSDADVTIRLVMPADPETRHPEMRTEGQLNNIGGGKYSGIAMVTMAGEWHVSATAVRGSRTIGEHSTPMTAVLSRGASDR